jgi:hypothetical protein
VIPVGHERAARTSGRPSTGVGLPVCPRSVPRQEVPRATARMHEAAVLTASWTRAACRMNSSGESGPVSIPSAQSSILPPSAAAFFNVGGGHPDHVEPGLERHQRCGRSRIAGGGR